MRRKIWCETWKRFEFHRGVSIVSQWLISFTYEFNQLEAREETWRENVCELDLLSWTRCFSHLQTCFKLCLLQIKRKKKLLMNNIKNLQEDAKEWEVREKEIAAIKHLCVNCRHLCILLPQSFAPRDTVNYVWHLRWIEVGKKRREKQRKKKLCHKPFYSSRHRCEIKSSTNEYGRVS